MARINITLAGRSFPIACDDGQEERVRQVAAYLDRRLTEVKAAVQSATDIHLLVMVSLLVADELFDARATLAAQAQAGAAQPAPPAPPPAPPFDETPVVEALARIAGRVESLAARLEQS